MKKLRLNLDQLEVESFDTSPDGQHKQQGTVFGNAQITPISCGPATCDFTGCIPCETQTFGGDTCEGTCGNSCGGTCGASCGGTCNTCQASCGGTCVTCGQTCDCVPTLNTCQSPSLCDGFICP